MFLICVRIYKIASGAIFVVALKFTQFSMIFSFTLYDFRPPFFISLSVFVEGGLCKLNTSTRKTIDYKTDPARLAP